MNRICVSLNEKNHAVNFRRRNGSEAAASVAAAAAINALGTECWKL